jgi:hypothetical protein
MRCRSVRAGISQEEVEEDFGSLEMFMELAIAEENADWLKSEEVTNATRT